MSNIISSFNKLKFKYIEIGYPAFRNFLSYKFNHPSPLPIGYFTVGITNSCNSKCAMCNIWDLYNKNPDMKNKELSSKTWTEKLTNSKLLKSLPISEPTFHISGGETFLKEGLEDLVISLHASLNFRNINIYSNGLLTDTILSKTENILKNIPSEKNICINISIDGINDIHDDIRGIKGMFKNASSTIKGLNILKRKYRNLKIDSGLVIQPKNIDSIKQVEDFWKRNNIAGNYMFILNSSYFDNKSDQSSYKFSEAQKEKLIKIAKNNNFIGFDKWLKTNKRPLKCYAGFTSIYIDPYGDCYPCTTLANQKEWIMGSLAENDLDHIWNSDRAWKIRWIKLG